jgi:hypothetical protein
VSDRTITRWLRELRIAGWIEARHTLHGQKYSLTDARVQPGDHAGHSGCASPPMSRMNVKNVQDEAPYLFNELYVREPEARGRAFPAKKPIQSEALARYYAQYERKTGS